VGLCDRRTERPPIGARWLPCHALWVGRALNERLALVVLPRPTGPSTPWRIVRPPSGRSYLSAHATLTAPYPPIRLDHVSAKSRDRKSQL